MEVVPFEVWHLAQIDPPALSVEDVAQFEALFATSSPAYTAMDGGRVLGCAGVQIVGEVGYAWAALSDAMRERPISLHRAIVRGLRDVEREYGLRSVEITVYEKFERAKTWAERLGFCFVEEQPNQFGTDMTYLRYVK